MSGTRKFYRWLALLLLLLLLIPGCKGKSGLSQDDNYSITTVSPQGQSQSFPVELSWNSNMVVVQKFLMEATFTLSDLHTIDQPLDKSSETKSPNKSIILIKAKFPQSRVFNLTINGKAQDLTLDSIEIEVDGPQPGRVTLNDTYVLQGIPNPNLKNTFDELLKMLRASAAKSSPINSIPAN